MFGHPTAIMLWNDPFDVHIVHMQWHTHTHKYFESSKWLIVQIVHSRWVRLIDAYNEVNRDDGDDDDDGGES